MTLLGCSSGVDQAAAAFRDCMRQGGFPVTFVSVDERPTDGALSFGFSLQEADNGAVETSERCAELAALSVGRAADL